MSFVSYFAIPMNLIILLVCRFPSTQVGAKQDLDALEFEEESVLNQYFMKKDELFWTRTNIIFFAILIEHVIIALKKAIAIVIPNLPSKVSEDEYRR